MLNKFIQKTKNGNINLKFCRNLLNVDLNNMLMIYLK